MKPGWKICRFVTALVLAGTAVAGDVPGWRRVGSAREDFEIFVDRDIRHGGAAAGRIECVRKRSKGTGTLEQDFRADEYRNRRIRMSAWVRAESAGRALIFIRSENAAGQVISFGNSGNQAGRGTDWRKQEVVIDVPPEATVIQMGLILGEKGKAWIDDLVLETVDKKIHPTSPGFQPGPPNPRRAGLVADHPASNLDFEQSAGPAR